ncbi:T9SS type A sorting domain-containing protein [candidate division TA06 bacterium]|uniref:T9SS type A sorting domain-containing protein n=1 Tax=candidate division TA06 bacterium TaxID=2250710 RepID=A0A523UYJ3_UNCT6|nr:MAG: T9SS type A sorting domain-containing protein [candidate division TA06 bacterium]
MGSQNVTAMHRAAGKRPSIRAFPSPFRHSTTIELLNVDPLLDHVVGVYDVAGRLVTKLPLSNGNTIWTANNHPAGIYFLKLKADTHSPSTSLRIYDPTTRLLKLE